VEVGVNVSSDASPLPLVHPATSSTKVANAANRPTHEIMPDGASSR
jgi:hypothetical protein